MTKTTIKLDSFKTPIPILTCKTQDGKEFLAMLDTGSEVTILDPRLYGLSKETSCTDSMLIMSIHDEEEKDASTYRLDFSIIDGDKNNHNLSLFGITSDLSSISDFMKKSYGWSGELMIVIGSDTMHSLEWLIDFENNQITI